MEAEELQHLNTQVLLMIAEYHLTSASQGTHHVLPRRGSMADASSG